MFQSVQQRVDAMPFAESLWVVNSGTTVWLCMNGNGRRSAAYTALNIMIVPAIPNASEAITTAPTLRIDRGCEELPVNHHISKDACVHGC